MPTVVHREAKSARRFAFCLVVVLQLPLVAELLRKYLLESHAVLVIAEACIVAVAALVLVKRPYSEVVKVVLWLVLVCFWQLVTVLLAHQNFVLAAVGLRAVLVPVSALIVSAHIFLLLPIKTPSSWMYRAATGWLAVIGGVALLQLALGKSSFINEIPPALAADEQQGIGDYTAGERELEGLFRPTSIFLHTGKYGQVAFFLAAYCLFYRYANRITGVRAATSVVAEISILLMSGQRAAILAYLFALVVLYFACGRPTRHLPLLVLAAAGGLVAWNYAAVDDGDETLGTLIFARVLSGVSELPNRVQETVLDPAGSVLGQSSFVGAGAGSFSLGSFGFGGKPLYEVVDQGTAENSWLRIWAELGVPGMLLFALAIGWLIAVGLRLLRSLGPDKCEDFASLRMLVRFCIYAVVVLTLWSNTHDVLGSTVTTAIAFGYCGALFLRPRRTG